jgi:hypothetical protein
MVASLTAGCHWASFTSLLLKPKPSLREARYAPSENLTLNVLRKGKYDDYRKAFSNSN